jgi:hypothetical protein
MRLPFSKRRTMPVMSSPWRSLKSLKIVGRQVEDLEQELVADLGLEAKALEVFEEHLAVRVLELVDHGVHLEELDLARRLVELRLDVSLVAEGPLGRRLDGGLHGLDEDLSIDPLLFADLVDYPR